MQLSYKFRLYPNEEQKRKMLEVLDRCRFIYNKMLEGLDKQDKPNRLELQNSIPKLKEEYGELKEVYSKVLQYESYRLFSNLKALARLKKNGRKVGRLRFKGEGWFKTFVYNQSGFKIVKTGRRLDVLHLSKIGEIKIRIHREIKGEIKQIVIKHYPSGKWYAFVCCEQEQRIAKNPNNKAVGIDLGTVNFIYDSEDNHINHPRFLNESLERLKGEQRKLSRKKGSKNRQKQRIKVARVHEKIANQRNDFLHKLSKHYADNYSFIAVEKLNIRRLIRNSYNPRNILDASWSKFVQFLTYKAVRAGGRIVEINPRGTTQICSKCGKIIRKELWNRTHKCSCGLAIDRDLNSARNILKLGLERARKPLETEPLLRNQQVQSMNQEAPFKRWE